MDLTHVYNDASTCASTQNQVNAKTLIPWFLCPSNSLYQPIRPGTAPPITWSSPTPTLTPFGLPQQRTRADGGLVVGGGPISLISDGTSHTIMIGEDTGRVFETLKFGSESKYADPIYGAAAGKKGFFWNGKKTVTYCGPCGPNGACKPGTVPAGCVVTPSGLRALPRWAEPDNANGVSGQANAYNGAAGTFIPHPINGNFSRSVVPAGTAREMRSIVPVPKSQPVLGAIGCYSAAAQAGNPCGWFWNNCGPNDELFSFHPGGCNVLLCDGGAHFLSDQIDPITLRYLCTRNEAIPTEGGGFLTAVCRIPPEVRDRGEAISRAGERPVRAPRELFWLPVLLSADAHAVARAYCRL